MPGPCETAAGGDALDSSEPCETYSSHIMAVTTTIRELRNHFPRVKKLVDELGEVVVTDRGTPKYRLARYAEGQAPAPAPKDYVARLRRHQPRPLSRAAARALDESNRGER